MSEGSTKPTGTSGKVPGSHPNPEWCRPCSPSRWLRERYLSPSSSRITGREIFITTTHCGQLRGVTWKMSCRVERIGHVNREAGGIFCCLKGYIVVWQRLREGHPRYKEGGSREPKQEDFFKVCHDPRWLLAKMNKKLSFTSPANGESEAQGRTVCVCAHRCLASDKGQCSLGTETHFI